jgi:hypothetical protein
MKERRKTLSGVAKIPVLLFECQTASESSLWATGKLILSLPVDEKVLHFIPLFVYFVVLSARNKIYPI